MSRRTTILIVEDQEIISAVEGEALARLGYRVLVAKTGEEAIRIADENPTVDLILMDVDLGQGPDGVETAKIILEGHDLPFVFISGDVDPELTGRMIALPSYGFVAKRSGTRALDASITMALRLFETATQERWAAHRLALTLEALPDQLFEVGLDGLIYDYHSPQPELLHSPRPQLIGKQLQDLHPPEVAELLMAALAEAELSASSAGRQFEMEVPRGRRWFEVSVAKKRGGPGQSRFIILKRDITERKRAELALAAALEENRTLLRELQHRAKNSFGMISGMIAISADGTENEEAQAALLELDTRVRSVAELYSLLYAAGSFSSVRLDDYCRRIAGAMAGLAKIELITDFEALSLPHAEAASLGLILTELVTNALKHAFAGRAGGRLRIELSSSSGQALLLVADDGRGPEGDSHSGDSHSGDSHSGDSHSGDSHSGDSHGSKPSKDPSSNPGMGLNLVRGLAAQLEGSFEIEGGEGGTICRLRFPLPSPPAARASAPGP